MSDKGAAAIADLRERLKLLKAAQRGGPLTKGTKPTAEGLITSAITLLEAELRDVATAR